MMFRTVFVSLLVTILIVISFYIYFGLTPTPETGGSAEDPKQVIVTTSVATFVGYAVQYEDRRVATFLAIPYALPPIGPLRFRKAVPFPPTSSRLEAKRWPNPCLQKDNRLQLNNHNFSEDCLYLNVWTPSATGQRPVVVHIHTGAYLFGSASEVTYNGLVLSALADVVVVTFNYRLNLYGFLCADGVDPNLGVHDQVLALQWVRQHIDRFGGDPSKVTLLGQSSGAQAIAQHILSPISRQLFQSAVLFSGSALQQTWLSDPIAAKEFWLKYSREVNCVGDEESMSGQTLECLSRLDRSRLPEMTDCKRYSVDPFVVSPPVVVDNEFRIRDPFKALTETNISVLFGYTEDEGSWLLALEDRSRFGPKAVQNLTFDEAKQELIHFLMRIESNTDRHINVDDIANHYFDAIPEEHRNDKNLMSRTIGVALGDFHISCPSHLFIDYLFKKKKNSLIYQYFWTYKGYAKTSSFWKTFSEVWCGQWMGSCHSFELYAVFGVPFQQRLAFNEVDRHMSRRMIEMVSNFAYHRRPLIDSQWQAFQRIDGQIIKPYHRIDFDMNSWRRFGDNLKTNECDVLWKPYLIR